MRNSTGWHWIPTPEWGGSDGSSIVDIARGTDIRPDDHFAREVIQNSWDAAQILRTRPGHQFKVRFRFVRFSGKDAQLIRERFALPELGRRLEETDNLVQGSNSLKESGDFKVLIAEDFGAHGLYGHPKLKGKSVLFRALYNSGGSDKFSSGVISGGSFGFGKSAFINASASNTVFAYSKFEIQPNDPVTRRFVGWSWHQGHELDGTSYEGRSVYARLLQRGSSGEPGGEPYSDDEADQLAAFFGAEERLGNSVNELGTSLILMDPVIDPNQLVDAVTRNWWPAIEDPQIQLDVEVVDYDGEILRPRPKLDESLPQLRRAFELATQPSDAPLLDTQKVVRLENLAGFKKIGNLGLVAVMPEEEEQTRHTPTILQTRLPRMIVGPHQHSWNPKGIKIYGVFAVSADASEADQALKKTEPHFHDHWSTIRDEKNQIPESATELAIQIEQKIVEAVNVFARELNVEITAHARRLTGFNKVLGSFFGSSKGAPKAPEGRSLPFSIRFGATKREIVDERLIRVMRTISLTMKEDDEFSDRTEVKVKITPEIFEVLDQSEKGDAIGLHVRGDVTSNPEEPGSYLLTLTRSESSKFELVSEPYSSRVTSDIRIELMEVEE